MEPEYPYARDEFSFAYEDDEYRGHADYTRNYHARPPEPQRADGTRRYGPGVPVPPQPSRRKSHTLRNACLFVAACLAAFGGIAAVVFGVLGGTGGYKPTDQAGVTACVNAFVKLHSDGITSRVLELPSSNRSASILELANVKDMENGAVCGTLTLPDRKYATTLINAKTGDDYKATKAAS